MFYKFTFLGPSYYAFLLTVVSLLLYYLNFKEIVWVFLGLGFFSVGLSHGALDYLTDIKINNRKQLFKFIIEYLFKGAFLGLMWFFIPDLALIVFILFSAWHFGYTDFREWKLKQGFNSFIWGLIVLAIILFYHHNQTLNILKQIRGLQIHNFLIQLSDHQFLNIKVLIAVLSISFVAYHQSKLMFLTVFYLILCNALPLIDSFAIYFVIQHSLQGWSHLKKDLNTNSKYLFSKALPFSLSGALMIVTFMLVYNQEYTGTFFILLSCISMPHIFSINSFSCKNI